MLPIELISWEGQRKASEIPGDNTVIIVIVTTNRYIE